MRKKVSGTNRRGVKNAAQNASRKTAAPDPGRCLPQYVPTAARNAVFLFSPVTAGRSIAGNALSGAENQACNRLLGCFLCLYRSILTVLFKAEAL